MKRLFAALALLVCVGLFFSGCSMKADVQKANTSVTRFHTQLDGQDYASIYNEADSRFRGASKLDDFLALMKAVHSKLGNVQSSTQQTYFVNYNTSGSTIRIVYATKFAGGDAREEFIWAKSGDKVQLLSYNINSNVLITK